MHDLHMQLEQQKAGSTLSPRPKGACQNSRGQEVGSECGISQKMGINGAYLLAWPSSTLVRWQHTRRTSNSSSIRCSCYWYIQTREGSETTKDTALCTPSTCSRCSCHWHAESRSRSRAGKANTALCTASSRSRCTCHWYAQPRKGSAAGKTNTALCTQNILGRRDCPWVKPQSAKPSQMHAQQRSIMIADQPSFRWFKCIRAHQC